MKIRAFVAMILAAVLLAGCSAAWQQGEVVVIREDRVTIHILAGQSTSDAGSEEMIQRVLQEKFPEIDFHWTCVDWGDGFEPQMTSKFAAGQMPDILIGKTQDVPVYQALGAIGPIGEEPVAGIDPEAVEPVRVEGEVYGIPYNVLYQGVLYNKSIFRELGLEVPRTRQELEEVVAACDRAGYTPFALHYGDVWSVGNQTMQLWMNDLFLQYPDWSSRFLTGQTDFAGEALVADAFAQCRYMLDHSYSDALQINQAECIKRFAQGDTAMFMTGTWSMQALSQLDTDLDWGLFPYPNTTGDARLLEETNLTFMKSSTTAHSRLVDQILLEIGTNESLAREIAEFSSADSTFASLEGEGDTFIIRESAPYRERGMIANVALGNSQFVWSFQNALAEQTLRYLEGKMSLEDLLGYAEEAF